MKFYPYKTIHEFLSSAHIGVINAVREGIVADTLTAYGFGAEKIAVGAALLATARELDAAKARAYGVQVEATEAAQTAWQAAGKTYATHRKLARLALRDDEQAQVALLLDEPKAAVLNKWLVQAEIFYANGLDNAEILTALGRYTVTEAVLMEGKTAVSHITHLRATQQQCKAAARRATKERNDTLNALYDWHKEFRAVAKIALEGSQLLETLGLKIIVK